MKRLLYFIYDIINRGFVIYNHNSHGNNVGPQNDFKYLLASIQNSPTTCTSVLSWPV